jgi:ubiquinone/menaquinone biosynthesis C-methylase UbiE
VFEVFGRPEPILEPFAGRSREGLAVDLNPEVRPDILADAQHLPLRDGVFGMVLMDPPYNKQELERYLGRRIRFSIYRAIDEAKRVVKPGGYLVLLHTLVPKHVDREHFRRVATIGITTGPNKHIRCLSVFRRHGVKSRNYGEKTA